MQGNAPVSPRSLRRPLAWGTLAFALAFAAACTDTYLYDQRRDDSVPADRSVSVTGEFCTPDPNETVRPIKILLAMDASQSMKVTDPDGTRATALIDLMNNLPNDPEVYISVMLFAGSTPTFLTRSGVPEFEQLISLTAQDRLTLVQKLLNFTVPGGMANRDSTDFVKAFSEIYALLSLDISNTRSASKGNTRGRYSVIFLSDGHPTNNQDDELLCGDAVRRVRQLKDLAEDVRVNTVHVFLPTQPPSSLCDLTGYMPPVGGGSTCRIPEIPPGACPLLLITQDAERLEQMANIGGGDFRDFRNNEPINFLSFRFGQVRRTFDFERLILTNFSALPGSPEDQADTDSDGLSDADEARERTSPWDKDTDGDGFSDGVEVHFRNLGGGFRPAQPALPDGGGWDPGCPPALRGVDSDCDGLTDCDEQLVGTNSLKSDSDDDGVPDAIEWQMQTQASAKDMGQDPDNDGLANSDEVQMHMDPLNVDNSKLSAAGYRYMVTGIGGTADGGSLCYAFRIDNVALANTLPDTRDAGNPDGGAPLYRRGAGYNDLYVSVAYRPGDDPNGRTIIKATRDVKSRYPVGGLRRPVDGVVTTSRTDFVDRCGATQTTTP